MTNLIQPLRGTVRLLFAIALRSLNISKAECPPLFVLSVRRMSDDEIVITLWNHELRCHVTDTYRHRVDTLRRPEYFLNST